MDSKIKTLIVGCGGLGSEIAKLVKNTNLTVMDYDTVEISNLNRQFFYLKEDIGSPKAEALSRKLNCKYINKRIEDLDPSYLSSFDVVFSCIDNVKGRMDLNYLFFQALNNSVSTEYPLLVDCGVEGFKGHVKIVSKNRPCLYCIKDLYRLEESPYLCTLKGMKQQVNKENRNQILKSIVFKKKETADKNKVFSEIVEEFNDIAPQDLKASMEEVKSLFEEILPNICTMNSICSSLAFLSIFSSNHDFIYIDSDENISIQRIKLEKDPNCFVCK